MSLRIRRGTEAQRPSATFDLGEIVYTTDTNKLYVGDGVNPGGKNILATSAGTGLVWNTISQRLDYNGSGVGIINVQADSSPVLGGNLDLNNRNITGTGNINIVGTVTATQFVGTRVSTDTSPSLSGNLDLNNRNITGTGNINIVGTVTATQFVGTQVSADPSPILGGNLNLNTRNIVGNGGISITGNITATQFVGNLNTASGSQIINGTTRTATLSKIFLDTNGSITTPSIIFDTPATTFITNTVSSSTPFINFYTASSASALTGSIGSIRSRGTTISPSSVVNGDIIGSMVTSAFSGAVFTICTDIVSVIDGTVSAGVVPSRIDLRVTNTAGVMATAMSIKPTAIEFTVPPKLPVIADDNARSTVVSTPTKGMLILMTAGTSPLATNKVQVWDGSAWVNLH